MKELRALKNDLLVAKQIDVERKQKWQAQTAARIARQQGGGAAEAAAPYSSSASGATNASDRTVMPKSQQKLIVAIFPP